MSLSGLLKGCGERERAFQEMLRSFLPEPKQFYTASGHKAFSKEYQLRAPAAQALERRDVAFVGTAFTNLAEVMVARAVERGKRVVLSFPLAFKGLELATEKLGSAEVLKQQLKDFFTASVLKVERFVKGGESIEKILPACYYLSKLEQLSGLYQDVWPKNIPAYLKAREQRELVADLERLCGVFNHVFIQSGLAGGKSRAVFRPSLGRLSDELGGAGVSFYLDGTLYYMKTSQTYGYRWREIAQAVSGYLLYLLDCGQARPTHALGELRVERLAFYQARFGEIEYLDLSRLDSLAIETAAQNLKAFFTK
ncbi:hypothetical protein [Hydrogeniiclostridium mannosilyticum]|uniref:hypothetical protein n=1 Tax=Hydrogeniiclostridium mannosilyticum TaxID=2764322 RepID=UPI0018A8A5D4|nr:hypothetical protein [Hydrogeniiclostridium mannosilyticum]